MPKSSEEISTKQVTFKLIRNELKKTKEKSIIHHSSVNSHLIKSLNYAIIYLILISLICEANGKSDSCSGRVKLTKPVGLITDGKKNYSPDLQCTWLIDASEFESDVLIRLKFTEFETECNWDHLYVFNGDSVFSQLVAAFSGVLVKRSGSGQGVLSDLPDLEIRSKQVYLYFYSDTAMNATGFSINYSIHKCQDSNCSKVSLAKQPSASDDSSEAHKLVDYNQQSITDHCSTDQPYSNISNCNCNDGIDSFVCSMSICPNKCSSQGECDLRAKKCNCKSDFAGADCGQILQEGYWSAINSLKNQKILGRALHQSALVNDRIWFVGGEFFIKSEMNDQFIINYDIKRSRWSMIEQQSTLNLKRFSHSLVHYNQSLYMYGGLLDNGTISKELWSYEIEQNKWRLIEIQFKQDQCTSYDYCAPLATTGHTATVIDDRMLVIFGYNAKYGYLNTVQEYHFSTKSWSIINAGGALIKGGFGHTSVYHEETKTIYVFGGHHSFITDSMLVDHLYAYLPYKNKWRLLSPSKSPRYFHTSVIINDQMYVYGGNAYNSTIDNNNHKCFSTQFLVYNIPCDTWNSLSEPSDLILNSLGTGRFGHSGVVFKNEMYIFGGFNGLMLNSLLKYMPANCSLQKSKNDCCKMVFTLNCVWDDEKKVCMEYNEEMALLNNRINTAITGANSKKSNFIHGTAPNENDQNTFCHLNFNAYNDRLNNSHSSNDYSRNKCPIKFSNNNELCKKQSVQNCPTCLENSYNCVWCDDQCYSEKCKKNSKRQSRNLQSCDAEDTSTLQFNCNKYHNCASCHVHPYCTWGINNACFPFVERSGNRTVKAVLHDNLRPPCEPPCHLQTTCENCTLNSCLWCSSLNRCIESNSYSAVFPIAHCLEWTIMPSKCSITQCAAQGTCEQCQKIHRCGWCDDGSNTGSGFCLEGHSRGPLNVHNNNYLIESTSDNSTANRLPNDRYNPNNKHLSDTTNRLMNLESTFLNKDDVNILDLYSVGNKPGHRFLASPSKMTCKADKWFFTECPLCQCNGHSQCKQGTSICNKPCLHDTEGEHCEECKSGFYGNAINGGKCLPCRCNSHSVTCDKRSSKCFCTTKGIVGQYCEKCDEQNHYFGNPKESTCFYNLSIDFQYTFNMSKYEDRHFNKINFMNIPHRPDLDVDFSISCSNKALFNISFGSATLPHRVLHERLECTNSFKFRFSHHEHLFGAENGSFYVNVYSFSYPFILQISFSQHRALDLVQFFVTFSSCFLTLLILAAIIWKIKQKFDMYRRRQQFFMELEHLASRPFAGILLEVPNSIKNQPTSPTNDDLSVNLQTNPTANNKPSSKLKAFTSAQRSHLKNFLSSSSTAANDNVSNKSPNIDNPTPIALEPCSNNKAAVLSLIVRLPTGGTGVIPIGQTGIAIASALVSLGPVEQKMHDNLKNSNSSKKTNNPAFV